MQSAAKDIETSVQALKRTIKEHDGENVVDSHFVQAVDHTIGVFYNDIGEIRSISIRSLFDLFVIKALYVEKRSRDAGVIDYLGDLLSRYLFTRELFPIQRGRQNYAFYFSDLLAEMQGITNHFQNLFEAYRKYADNALFITGLFPRSLRWRGGRRSGRMRGLQPMPHIDRTYYISTGRECYGLAAQHDLAELTEQRAVLYKLSHYFEVYVEALSEISERYILGFDMNVIADKLLDNFNLYRRTGEQHYLENARKYAAILKVDGTSFPKLFQRSRAYII